MSATTSVADLSQASNPRMIESVVEPRIRLSKYSLGVGDRFGHQAKAQLRACMMAAEHGIEIAPVWNKSNREHTIVGSKPPSVLAAAKRAVSELGWTKPWHVDADHINTSNIDGFLESSDFFTLDVADYINKPAKTSDVEAFLACHRELLGPITLPGIDRPIKMSAEELKRIAQKYLFAVQEAGRIYRHIEQAKGKGKFITEVSMDETDAPQVPAELLAILVAVADEGIPAQTIAPKFTGRFNKGVDYVGNPQQFKVEFRSDVAVIAHAVKTYGLPAELKLSIHSGSDKFSIYPAINRALRDFGAGVHVKTAGTTWLEECIGLAEHGGEGLELAKEIYAEAFDHSEELCAPYATVIDIDPNKLPDPGLVCSWTSEQFVNTLRHDQACPEYNSSFRQLIHVGYKVAAKLGNRYLGQLEACEETISRNVTRNLFERHIRPIFVAK
jgi:tagaturonate epimerase